jgi:outer membrane protein with beta-barrel domain
MRILATLAVITATLVARPALAQRRGAPAPAPAPIQDQASGSPIRLGALLGFESIDLSTGVALRADAEFPLQQIAPMVGLSIVGSLGYSHFSDEGAYYDWYGYGYEDSWESSIGILKVIPAARFTFGRMARLRPYADAGLGLYYASWNHKETTWTDTGYPYYAPYAVETSYDDSQMGVVLRFAGGVNFDVAPRFSIGGELGFTPYLGDLADGSGFQAMFSAQFRL